MAVQVLVRVELKPEHLAEARQAAQAMLAPTRAEPGCESYEVFTTNEQPNVLFFIETWRDRAAIDQHMARDHTQALFKNFETWLAGAPVILNLQALAPSA